MLFFRKREPNEPSWTFGLFMALCVVAVFVSLRIVFDISEEWTKFWLFAGFYLGTWIMFRSDMYIKGKYSRNGYLWLTMGLAAGQIGIAALLHRTGWLQMPRGAGTWGATAIAAGLIVKGIADRVTRIETPYRPSSRRRGRTKMVSRR